MMGRQRAASALRSASWVLAESLARSTKVEAKPMTSNARAYHGAWMVGLVTLQNDPKIAPPRPGSSQWH
jgi:hypothetical protein